jgi:hypothetical protein
VETRERQPGGGFQLVDPRDSFLIRSLAEAAGTATPEDSLGEATGETAVGDAEPETTPAEQPAAKYAKITVRRFSCPIDATGDELASCRANVEEGVPFTVYNPTGHGRTRTTGETGRATFGPRAGWNVIAEDADVFAASLGAYVVCEAKNTGRVLFEGALDGPQLSLDTVAGERIVCDWFARTAATVDAPEEDRDRDQDQDHDGDLIVEPVEETAAACVAGVQTAWTAEVGGETAGCIGGDAVGGDSDAANVTS